MTPRPRIAGWEQAEERARAYWETNWDTVDVYQLWEIDGYYTVAGRNGYGDTRIMTVGSRGGIYSVMRMEDWQADILADVLSGRKRA